MGPCEACQVRKEAALSKVVHVPWGCLARANCRGNVWGEMSTSGARAFDSNDVAAHYRWNRENARQLEGLVLRSKTSEKRFGGSMKETAIVSCGGVVIYRNKVLLLYTNRNGRHKGWVLPKGGLEPDETLKQTALREVKEESDVSARLQKYLGKTEYSFKGTPLGREVNSEASLEIISKTVHWYLMTTNSFYCKPQTEEHFVDIGFYKQHEAYYLLKYDDERQIMSRAFMARDKINSERKLKNTERTNKQ